MFEAMDKRYLSPRFLWNILRYGRRRTWGRLSEAERQECRKLALKYNFTLVEHSKNGIALCRQAVGGFHEFRVDFGFKRMPVPFDVIFQMIDMELFKTCLANNPGLMMHLLTGDIDRLREEIGFSEHAHFIKEAGKIDKSKLN